MAFASYQPGSDRRRVVSFVLTVIAHVLLLILLLTLTPRPPVRVEQREPTSFTLSPSTDATTAPKGEKAASAAKTQRRAAAQPSKQPERPVVVPPPPVPPPPPVLLAGGKELFDAADISKLPSHPEDRDGAGDDAGGSGKDSAAVYGPGEGPGGQRLYNAEWYREPTDAELGYWLPKDVPPGSWAMVACKTVPAYHVENCRALGESPIGSGLGRAIRQAAWQFLVRPPRIGGQAQIGAWVRIRIDFTETGAKVRRGR